eukprot:TRINITY_DN4690_c0_g1_i1.p1 TRINITY_DN4690_c0_g1~~TRINITY_DN4690_c0_g1_i1.p1  ORF type:complete len:517 (-),score=75.69 TRINITY_DN4690_c0_g1_i1:158-1708(-)
MQYSSAPSPIIKQDGPGKVDARAHTAPCVLASGADRDDTFDSWLRSTTRLGFLQTPERQAKDDKLGPGHVGVNILKCAVGAGSFSLPYAFRNAGMWAGVVLTCVLGLLCYYTINLLVDAERMYARSQCPLNTRLTYPALCRHVFGRAGPAVELFVKVAIGCIALGACAAYVDFITSTLVEMGTHLSHTEATVLILGPIIGLVLLRSFAFVSITSLVGDIAVLSGLVTTIVYGATHRETNQSLGDFTAVKWGGIGGFIGPTAFLFAIHFLMIPFAHSLKEEASFRKVTAVTYSGITVINALFGAGCLYLFGDATAGNVVTNMADGTGAAQTYVLVVKGLLCVDLLFTIPPVFASVRAVVEDTACEMLPASWMDNHDTFTRNIVRLGLVGVICTIAFCVPDFNDMVSLTGGVFMTITGFVLPPLIYNRVTDIVVLSQQQTHHAPLVTPPQYVPTDERTGASGLEGYTEVKPDDQAPDCRPGDIAPLWMVVRVFHLLISVFGLVLLGLSSYYTVDNFGK